MTTPTITEQMAEALGAKLENIISGHRINDDDADWLRAACGFDAAQQAGEQARCDCGKKAATECEKWEPGCHLGTDPEYAKAVQLDLQAGEQGLPPLPIEWRKVEDADGIEVPVFRAFQMRDYALTTLQQPADPPPAHGDINGRHDELRPALHGRVLPAHRADGALVDRLFASDAVMGLNAELGLTMDQLVPLARAMLAATEPEPQQPAQAVPLSAEQKRAMWVAATIDTPSPENCYLRGIEDAERAHGIGVKLAGGGEKNHAC